MKSYSWEEVKERMNKIPWYRILYYRLRRFYKDHLSPRTHYYNVKYFLQRGRRGWADCDTWSLDNYLSEWLPEALRYLKAHKHGVPCSMFKEEDGLDDSGNPSNRAMEQAITRWNVTMTKMIVGFDAYNRIQCGLYETELGPYDHSDERFQEAEKLRQRDEQLWKEGSALFIEHFRSLWD